MTLVVYNVVAAETGEFIVDWDSVAQEKFLGESETECFVVCLECGMKRLASVRWDGVFEHISDRPEPH